MTLTLREAMVLCLFLIVYPFLVRLLLILNSNLEVELVMNIYMQNLFAEENWKMCLALIFGLQLIITLLIVFVVIGLGPLGA